MPDFTLKVNGEVVFESEDDVVRGSVRTPFGECGSFGDVSEVNIALTTRPVRNIEARDAAINELMDRGVSTNGSSEENDTVSEENEAASGVTASVAAGPSPAETSGVDDSDE